MTRAEGRGVPSRQRAEHKVFLGVVRTGPLKRRCPSSRSCRWPVVFLDYLPCVRFRYLARAEQASASQQPGWLLFSREHCSCRGETFPGGDSVVPVIIQLTIAQVGAEKWGGGGGEKPLSLDHTWLPQHPRQSPDTGLFLPSSQGRGGCDKQVFYHGKKKCVSRFEI